MCERGEICSHACAGARLVVPSCFWSVDIECLFCGVTVVGVGVGLMRCVFSCVLHVCLCVVNELVSRCFVVVG